MRYVPKNNIGKTVHKGSSPSKKAAGQATILIALSIVALIAVIGLAVDGGSMYAQRRNAQNSADAAAMAATEQMLTEYQAMVLQYPDDHDGTPDQENRINDRLIQYANAHGIPRSSLHAYYVNDSKQIVSNVEVGQLGVDGIIPWTQGAKGIIVKNTSDTNAFIMKLFGWNTVSASASASAFMGLAVDSGVDTGIFPVGFFTETQYLNSLIPEHEYTLINGNQQDEGNWGYIDFNGRGNASSVIQEWMACGYNASLTTPAQWTQWCNGSNENNAIGPTRYKTGWSGDPPGPTSDFQTAPTLHWGEGENGWWIGGAPGRMSSNCSDLESIAAGQHYLVPVFDATESDVSGNNTMYHLRDLYWFRISDANIDCQGSNAHWHINGIFEQKYTAGSSGRHGDIRHVSQQTVFLDN